MKKKRGMYNLMWLYDSCFTSLASADLIIMRLPHKISTARNRNKTLALKYMYQYVCYTVQNI